MKKQSYFTFWAIVLICLLSFNTASAIDLTLQGPTPAQVYFSPEGGATAAILHSISGARSEILIQAYSFRSPAITEALLHAHKKGVKVQLIVDKSELMEGLTSSALLDNAGIPVFLDGMHAVANNRVIIIDGQILMTGSFNFNTASEELNAENFLILKSKELSVLYRENWLNHRKHSKPLSKPVKEK